MKNSIQNCGLIYEIKHFYKTNGGQYNVNLPQSLRVLLLDFLKFHQ